MNVFRLTVSVGLSTFTGAEHEVSEIIRSSDAALYTAKRKGKNQVVIV
ncbi:MAG: diguanylate cyclase [Planctomycetota bacterium]